MGRIKELLARTKTVEVAIVLFRDDFFIRAMQPEPEPAVKDMEECWRVEPKPGWTVTADDQDIMTAHAAEPCEAPAGWQWVATMALLVVPYPNRVDGLCSGRALWFPMVGVDPTPRIERFLAFLCNHMLRRAGSDSDKHKPDTPKIRTVSKPCNAPMRCTNWDRRTLPS